MSVDLRAAIAAKGDRRGTLSALMRMAWPSIGSGWVKASYSLADIWCAGRISTTALTSLAAAVLFVWVFHSLSQTNSTGALSLISRAVGAGDRERAAALARRACILALALGACVAIGIGTFATFGLGLLQLTSEVEAGVARYLIWIVALGPGLYLYDTLEQVFRAIGRPRLPLMVFGGFALLNLGLNPFLALTLELGLVGVAIATGLAWWGAAVVLLLLGRREGLWSQGAASAARAWTFWRIGLPTALAGVAFDLIWLLLLPVLAYLDENALAAITVAHRLESVSYLTGVGVGMACAALVGQAIGMGRPDLARRVISASAVSAFALASAWVAALLLFSRQLMGVFTSDPLVVEHGVDYLAIASLPITIQAVESVFIGAFAGVGRTLGPSLIAFVCYGARVPLVYGLAPLFGVTAIFAVVSGTSAMSGIAVAVLFIVGAKRYLSRQS